MQLYVLGFADSVLIREVSLIQSILFREVPLHSDSAGVLILCCK